MDSHNNSSVINDTNGPCNGSAHYEDEINLIDYFLVLGRHKLLIILGSLIPTIVIGMNLFLSPRDYMTSYTYTIGMGEEEFNILEDTFYSEENIQKLVSSLKKSDLSAIAEDIISFEVWPPYFEDINVSRVKNLEYLQKMKEIEASLLVMRIKCKSKENIRKAAMVCRENFEQIIPIYSLREQVKSKINNLRGKMGDIESSRFNLDQQLKTKQTTLGKLKKTSTSEKIELPNDLVLQFNNAAQNSQYLPIAYQLQALKTQIIDLEEEICSNKENYNYYTKVLELNHRIFDHLQQDGDIKKYQSSLTDIITDYEDIQELKDYLSAYIKQIENKIAARTPVVEEPRIYSAAKGTVKKSGVVFVTALMVSAFAAFLSEGLKKAKS